MMIRKLLNTFWDERFWLPPNMTWEDVTPGPDKEVTYTDHRHLLMAIPMALVLLLLRFVLEKFLFTPLGKALGVKDNKCAPNPILEEAYRDFAISKKIGSLESLAKQSDMSERQVLRWWCRRRRRRLAPGEPDPIIKFRECTWRSAFLFCNLLFAIYVFWDKEWLWDMDQWFAGYPHQDLTNDVWWFYMVIFVYYLSETVSWLWCVGRKDFLELMVHHIVIVAMMSLGWICNFHRMASLVYWSHDSLGSLLEAVKAAASAGYRYHRFCDCVFSVYTVLWIVTKLGFYPLIIWAAEVRAPLYWAVFPVQRMVVFLMYVLMALDMYWTWCILKLAYTALKVDRNECDILSSDSGTSSDEGTQQVDKNKAE